MFLKLSKKIFFSIISMGVLFAVLTPPHLLILNNGTDNNIASSKIVSDKNKIAKDAVIGQNTSTINEDGTVSVHQSDNTLKNTTVANYNPNTYKAVPNGYVYVTSDNSNNYLVSVDANDPSQVLWYCSFSYRTILQVEYLPASDALVVLSTHASLTQLQNYTKAWYDIKITQLDNVTSLNNQIDYNSNTIDVLSWEFSGDANNPLSYLRGDMWGISPIFNSDGPTTEFLIFSRFLIRANSNPIYTYLYNSTTRSITFSYNITVQNQMYRHGMVLSIGGYKYNGKYYLNPVYFTSNKGFKYEGKTFIQRDCIFSFVECLSSTGTYQWKGNYYKYTPSADFYGNSTFLVCSTAYTNANFDWDFNSVMRFCDFVSGLVITPSVTAYSNGIKFAYMMNTPFYSGVWFCSGQNNINYEYIHGCSKLINVTIPWDKNAYEELSNSAPTVRWNSILSADDYDGGQLFTGYFDNTYALKYGLKNMGGNSGPFVGVGAKGTTSSLTYGNWFFTFVLNNPVWISSDQPIYWDTENNTNTIRNYFYEVNGYNRSDYYGYALVSTYNYNPRVVNINQQNYGVPILQYDDSIDRLSNVWDTNNANIFLTANTTKNSIMIDIKDRGTNNAQPATYTWNTRVSNTTLDIGDINVLTSAVNVNYLRDNYGLNNSYNELNTSPLLSTLGLINIRKDAYYDANNFIYDYVNGLVTFDLYTTIKYDEVGHLHYTDLQTLQDSYPSEHKLATITLNGFKPATKQIKTTINVINNYKKIPSEISDDILKTILYENHPQFLSSLPSTFNIDSFLDGFSIERNDKTGTINITNLYLNNYINPNSGLIVDNATNSDNGFLINTLTLTGFLLESSPPVNSKKDSTLLPIIIGTSVGGILLIVAIILISMILIRKRKSTYADEY